MIRHEPREIPARIRRPARDLPATPLARIARLVVEGESIRDELRRIDDQVASARAYLESGPENRLVAEALVRRLTDARSAALAHLRANRDAAREFAAA